MHPSEQDLVVAEIKIRGKFQEKLTKFLESSRGGNYDNNSLEEWDWWDEFIEWLEYSE